MNRAFITGTTDAAVVQVERWRLRDVSLPSTIAVRIDLPDPPSPPSIPGLSRPAPSLQGFVDSDLLSRFGSSTVDI